jgi:hypothetical protein
MQVGVGRGSWAWQAVRGGGLLCFCAFAARAQSLSVSGSPGSLAITTAIAGQPPTSDNDATTTYTVKAQKKNQPLKVTGRLNAAMPPGVTLTVSMVAPSGATSNGTVTLDATTRDLVGDITNTNALTQGITYILSATAAAGVVTPQSRTVTLTLTAWP